LWNEIDFEIGNANHISDEDLLHRFAMPVQALLKNPSTKQQITEHDIRALIRVAGLKPLFRSSNPTDFQAGILKFGVTVFPLYKDWLSGNQASNQLGVTGKITLDWSPTFVVNVSGHTVNGNHRVPIAVRILFFALPDMMFFNFSNDLSKAMQLQTRPQAALPNFNQYLFQGIIDTKNELDKLKMPAPTIMTSKLLAKAEQNGWWQRRVLDLALLLHFNKISCNPLHRNTAAHIASIRSATTV
jgi:hypothetical protein